MRDPAGDVLRYKPCDNSVTDGMLQYGQKETNKNSQTKTTICKIKSRIAKGEKPWI